MSGAAERARPAAVSCAADADRLLAELRAAMAELVAVLETETRLVEAGRIREGLAEEGRKSGLSGAYILKLQHAKANVVALARFAPDGLRAFRNAQSEFERVVDRNQTVIATARAVSEGLIKSLAEEMERQSRPQGYGAVRPVRPAAAVPLAFSGRF
ncbi:MAG: hypothetical protein JWR08_1024 [Enterovirga sp.]|nr:hypothetical protein [Enterovirga sp.]